jgi:nitroimidazol reductase NimA-like FMN-containing flavoprotein (pyridoxamine 5'-phosphate oxidase superfamily)
MIRRLSEEESLSLLRGQRIARLGCVAGGEPYVVPISYVFDDRFAYGRYEEIIGHDERADALNCLLSLFPQLTPVESRIAEDAASPPPVVFRIRIDSLTGIGEE